MTKADYCFAARSLTDPTRTSKEQQEHQQEQQKTN